MRPSQSRNRALIGDDHDDRWRPSSGGYQRVWTVASLNLLTWSVDVIGNYVALFVLGAGLAGSGLATLIALGAGALVLILGMVGAAPPSIVLLLPLTLYIVEGSSSRSACHSAQGGALPMITAIDSPCEINDCRNL